MFRRSPALPVDRTSYTTKISTTPCTTTPSSRTLSQHDTSPYINVTRQPPSPYVNLQPRRTTHPGTSSLCNYVNLQSNHPDLLNHTYVNITGFLSPPLTPPPSPLTPPLTRSPHPLTPLSCSAPVATSTLQDTQHQDPTYLTLNYTDHVTRDIVTRDLITRDNLVTSSQHRLIPDSLLPPPDYVENLIILPLETVPLNETVPTLYTEPQTSCCTPLLRLTRRLFRCFRKSSKKKKTAPVKTYFKDNFVFSKL